MKTHIILTTALLVSFNLFAENNMTQDELDKWFNEDDSFSTDQVNEGDLKFLVSPPDKPVLHSMNNITINQHSIKNGWVRLNQCYKHLDPVPVAEIVYHYKSIRNLRISHKHNIGSAQLKGQSVQLSDVFKDAELCIKAEVKILYKKPDGRYVLVNGPFHRKFLDGYYPYHVTLKVNYPAAIFKQTATTPKAQKGFTVNRSKDLIIVDSYFEGILNTEIIFW